MIADFFCTWDSSVNSDLPSSLAPANTNIEITGNAKYGDGCIHPIVAAANANLSWLSSFSVISRNVGIIDWWFKQNTPNGLWQTLDWSLAGVGNNSRVIIDVTQTIAPNQPNVRVRMWDNTGAAIINQSFAASGTPVNNTWKEVTVLWEWNAVGGITEVLIDSVSIGSSAAGAAKDRSYGVNAINTSITLNTLGGVSNLNYADHLGFGQLPSGRIGFGSPMNGFAAPFSK